jgi:TonB-linked SusC/RagA family outer membrane protein
MRKFKPTGKWGWFLHLSLSLLLMTARSYAQETNTFTGTVSSATDSRPLGGASIRLKGSSKGVTTDENGKFTIHAKAGDLLEISSIGFLPQQLRVGTASSLAISLTQSTNGLDEVVVVGYGTQKKKVLTGSTVRVGGEDLEKNHNVSVGQSLQGQAAGVQVTSNSGQPGDALRIRIRGVGTNGDPSPLFVVDGMPTTDITYLNPGDVESIDVLKDAASSSIYGTQAANGVVLITTKKGKVGRRSVTFDAYYGWQNPMKKLDMLNGKEYTMIMNEAGINSGKAPFDNSIYPFSNFTTAQLDSIGSGTDWQKATTIKNAVTQSYNLGMSGGNDQSIYSSSLAYQKQQGLLGLPGRSYYERISFRINSEHKLYKDIFKMGENLTYTHSNQSGIGTGNIYGNSIRGLLNTSPLFPAYNPDGSYGTSKNAEEINPVAAMDYLNNNKTIYDRIFGDVYGELTLLKGLKFRTDYGIDLSYNSTNTFTPLYTLSSDNLTTTTTAGMGLYRNFTWNWDNTLTYQHSFGDHNLTLLAGTEAKEYSGFNVSGTKQDLILPDFENAVINAGTNALTQKAYGTRVVSALQSYFGRVNYNYKEKYLLMASIRRDGSTRFGANKRYGVFPAFSAGWVATNEDFLKPTDWLGFLKIRGGWGKNGSDRIGDFKYLATVSSLYQGYYFGGEDNTSVSVGTSPDKIPNPNLQWEASEQTDLGFDATVFRHLTINFDVYNKTTRNWLVTAPIPAIVGTGAPTINGGSIVNKGLELALNYQRTLGKLTLGIGGNIAFNKNTVQQVPTADKIIHGATNVLSSSTEEFYRIQDGHPVGYFWGYKTAGIFQNQAQVNSYTGKQGLIQPGALPGDVKFVDLNGDGVIDVNDKTQIGSPLPTQTFGINLTAAYKGFDLAIYFSGVGGNQIVDGVRATDRYYNNYTTAVLNRWHGEGTSNTQPRVTLGDEANKNWGHFSDLYLHNGAFLRVKSLNIGYDLKKGLLKELPVRTLRLYASALNLWTFTHYRGIDPEVGYGNTESDGNNWSSGIDLGYYPQPRTFLVGLNVGL